MENQVDEILGVKETEPAKEKGVQTSDSARNLRIVGTIILWLGIVVGLSMLFATCIVDSGEYTYTEDKVFNPMCLVYFFSAFIPSLTIWAFAKAVADIVDNMRK